MDKKRGNTTMILDSDAGEVAPKNARIHLEPISRTALPRAAFDRQAPNRHSTF